MGNYTNARAIIKTRAQSYKLTRNHTNARAIKTRAIIQTQAQSYKRTRAIIQMQAHAQY